MQISGLNTQTDNAVRAVQQSVQQTAKSETQAAEKHSEPVASEGASKDVGNVVDTLA